MASSRAFAPPALVAAGLGLMGALMAPALPAAAQGVGLDPRLGALLGQERAALRAVAPGHVERILTPASGDAAPQRQHGGSDVDCLTSALYHEARGEGETGMRAVAEVVLNRAESGSFPDSVCAVVRQGSANGTGCQFSFVCDGSEARPREPRAWTRAERIARDMAGGAARNLTDGATHFHTVAVRPHWSRVFPMTAEIGAHRFYRRPVELASN